MEENESRKSGGEGGIRTLATNAESVSCGEHITAEAAVAAGAAGVCDMAATRLPAPGSVWRHRRTGEVRLAGKHIEHQLAPLVNFAQWQTGPNTSVILSCCAVGQFLAWATEADELKSAGEQKSSWDRDHVWTILDDVLLLLSSRGVPTPERTYKLDGGWPMALSDLRRHIAALTAERDAFRTLVQERERELAIARQAWEECGAQRDEAQKIASVWEKATREAVEQRDEHEEQLNRIFTALGMTEDESRWSNANNPAAIAEEWAGELRAERDEALAEVARLKATWRCFSCGFETQDRHQAYGHFGGRGDEDSPLCVTWQELASDERTAEYQNSLALAAEQADRASKAESEVARLREALERIHKGACLTAQDSRSREDDHYCLADVIEVSSAALAGEERDHD